MQVPHTAPTRDTAARKRTDRSRYCQAYGMKEMVLPAVDTDRHETRCCNTGKGTDGFWFLARDGGNKQWCKNNNVWGLSAKGPKHIHQGCKHRATFAQAQKFCANMGGRLCTREELANDCTAGTGCGHDNDLVWTSERFSNEDQDDNVKPYGSKYSAHPTTIKHKT